MLQNIYIKKPACWKFSFATYYNIFQYKTVILNADNISQHDCLYCIFVQINAALVSRRDFSKIIITKFTKLLITKD